MNQLTAEKIERKAASDLARRDDRKLVATTVLLVCGSIAVALLATTLGAPLPTAAITGAACAVASVVAGVAVYRKLAARRWGAQFSLDEHVRVVSGDFAGCQGVVVGTDQAQRPCVRLAKDGLTFSVLLPWHQVRRVAATDSSET